MRLGIELLPDKPCYEVEYLAVLSENCGYESVWITEHYNNRNPYPILSLIALKTSKVEIGVGVTNPYTMHPALICSAIMTVDEISNGRAVLGISAGDKTTLESIGIRRKKPLRYVKEAVEIMKSLMNGERVEYEGEIFRMRVSLPFQGKFRYTSAHRVRR